MRSFLIIITFLLSQVISGQKKDAVKYPIPDSINSIIDRSCLPCHGSSGGRFPTARLNFSRWDGYGPAKEIDKAQAICTSVRKGTMPTKEFMAEHPESVLTKTQVAMICRWANSLRQQKGGRPFTVKQSLKKTGR